MVGRLLRYTFPVVTYAANLSAPTLFLKTGLPNEHERIFSEGNFVPSYSGNPAVPS